MALQEKENIGSLFNRIAAKYDRFNHLSSLGIDYWWRKKAIRQMRPIEKALDVAIGTGDFAIEMVQKGKAKEVVGIDLSCEMMRIGMQKVAKKQLANSIRFEEGSALEMPYADATFDALTCAYGVRNFSNLDKGLQEFQRLLKPGGQLLILEFSYPENKFIAWLYDFYFNHIMTLLGRMMTSDKAAFRYFYASVKNFIWGKEMLQHLAAAGFKDAHYQTMTFGISTLYMATKQN